jgi:hypothetical protein
MFRGVKTGGRERSTAAAPARHTKVEELIARRMAELMHRGINVRNRIIY